MEVGRSREEEKELYKVNIQVEELPVVVGNEAINNKIYLILHPRIYAHQHKSPLKTLTPPPLMTTNKQYCDYSNENF